MAKEAISRADQGNIVGGAWLVREYDLALVQRPRYISKIAGDNIRKERDGFHENSFIKTYSPKNTLAGHLEFMLKYERIHLELLSRLFEKTGREEITEWIAVQPTGQYARRAAWLYEWLTGSRLDVPDLAQGAYIEALDPSKYWTAPKPRNEARFRVRNNMPGTRDLCPMVLLQSEVQHAIEETDVPKAIDELETQFGADLIRRASIWLTVKESRSSFKIEGEGDKGREDRFAVAMERYLGELSDLFGQDLETLQQEVLGSRTIHLGLRQSPIFVGQTIRLQNIVHYVAPHQQELESMIAGLSEVMNRTAGSSPIIRAAALSFAFVYMHPLCDGNGRVSRFIINDVLRRDGLVQAPLVVPVSATISKDMQAYDRTLELFSRPLKQRYGSSWRFGKDARYPDGEISNFEFDEYRDALHAWRYLDLTSHVVYLSQVIRETLRTEMVEEAEYLRKHYEIRERLNEVIQVSDNSLDRIIRSVTTNRTITGALLAEYPLLADSEIREQVLRAVLGL